MNKLGDRKIERKFAWFPLMINGEVAWLRDFSKVYEYKNNNWVEQQAYDNGYSDGVHETTKEILNG